jgi:hypothetical protein
MLARLATTIENAFGRAQPVVDAAPPERPVPAPAPALAPVPVPAPVLAAAALPSGFFPPTIPLPAPCDELRYLLEAFQIDRAIYGVSVNVDDLLSRLLNEEIGVQRLGLYDSITQQGITGLKRGTADELKDFAQNWYQQLEAERRARRGT